MFVLHCPSCQHQVRARFARLGATATCPYCHGLFKVDEQMLAAPEPDPLPPAADQGPPPFRRAPLRTEPRPVQKPSAPARSPLPTAPRRRELRSPEVLVLMAMGAFAAALVVGVFTGEPDRLASPSDMHPLPAPLALAARSDPVPPQSQPGAANLAATPPPIAVPGNVTGATRVTLRETRPDFAAVEQGIALEALESHMGITDDPQGQTSLVLVLRNPTDRLLRNPRFTIEVLDATGSVECSWQGELDVTLQPGQTIEVQAVPPPGMDRAAGRISLRAFATPAIPTP